MRSNKPPSQRLCTRGVFLPDDALTQLVDKALKAAETANDYSNFTSSMNEQFTQAQKIAVDPNEISLIGKIANLLFVTQGEYIGATMRAKEDAQLAR